jgi:hypothetical protein
MQVDVLTMPVVAVSDNSGTLTVDAPVGTPVFVRLSDGASAISTLPVSLASVPSHAVTNAGTFATQESGAALTALQLIDNLVLTEDAAHNSGDPGLMPLAVRRDANTSLVSTDGDYAPLQVDATGSLKVAIISGAGSGGTSATDDAAFSVASGSGTPIMGLADETSPDAVDEGDVGVVRMTLQRGLHVNLRDSSGNEVSVGGGTQYDEDTAHVSGDKLTLAGAVRRDTATSGASTDGDRATINVDGSGRLWVNGSDVTQPISAASLPLPTGAATSANQTTGNSSLATIAGAVSGTEMQVDVLTLPSGTVAGSSSLPAGTNNIGDVDVLTVPTDPFGANADAASATGSISAKLRFIAATGIPVTSLPASTNTIEVVGDAAHDAAASGNPVLMGAYGNASPPNGVTDGDAVRLWARNDGSLVVNDAPRTSGGLTIHRRNAVGTSGDATNVKASAGQLYGWSITNTNAAVRYVKLYNSASAPTAGSGTPVMVLAIPGNTAGAGSNFHSDKGIAFSSGIGFTIVTGAGDSSSTSVTADEVIVNLFYA